MNDYDVIVIGGESASRPECGERNRRWQEPFRVDSGGVQIASLMGEGNTSTN